MENIRQKIINNVKPKLIMGKPVNGKQFLEFAKMLVNTVNSG